MYDPNTRRLLINSDGRSASVSVPLHEFGHAADTAYGDLSAQPEWSATQQRVAHEMGTNPNWNHYYNHPQEFFAESFAAWGAIPSGISHWVIGR